ncbi:phosphotransferase system, mannose/fructose/N-acetylgalactosamine-specific component IID [Moorella thermoacetica Y72]|uniref:Phosphotransferase system, mannose/fructose/N-acetylgalactosamine-specific component IID n=1 Tax=Moorella thermoacetica Y72 TaxID=1325331 RepID=A0A0S6U9V9_NEOTH|nr:PTS system mannose/fructose/sorbose family transporter subunit IID [Moorella thermoacetica]GAF25509.1 phosphotransferase system, mannose/fructose/N-acetylgalactosamine-specific component IID [Moorella thermoacetica Y72]
MQEQPAKAVPEITKKDLRAVTLRWLFFNTSAWNWERMQHTAFAWSLLPVLKKLYPGREELGAALKRHMVFFNTEMTIGSPIIGAIAAIERQKAAGEEIADETINAIKSGLMGPFAAIGDSLWASAVNAILLSFAMSMALQGNILGPVIYAIAWIALTWYMMSTGINLGYRLGVDVLDSELLTPQTIERVTRSLNILGLVVVGALSATFVSLSTPIQWTLQQKATTLQSILDGMMPKFLPLLWVGLVWYLHQFRNWSIMKLLGFTIVVGFVGSLLKIF